MGWLDWAKRKARVARPGRALRVVREGFHRHDKCAEPPLDPSAPAFEGAQVKLQMNLHLDLACANDPGQGVSSLAMGGRVEKVLAPDRVRVGGLVSTTDMAPLDFSGEWSAELVRVGDVTFPWTLASLSCAEPGGVGRGVADDSSIFFKIALCGEAERRDAILAEVASKLGAEPENGSLLLRLPVKNWQNDLLLCGPTGDLAESEPAQELLLNGADAVLFATPDAEARARARLQRHGGSLDAIPHALCTGGAFESIKSLAKELLTRARTPSA